VANNPSDVEMSDIEGDGDGYPDESDAFPENPAEWADTDGDHIGDNADADDDSDGWPDEKEKQAGTGIGNSSDFPVDFNNDSEPDYLDDDIDGDGYGNELELTQGANPEDNTSMPADMARGLVPPPPPGR